MMPFFVSCNNLVLKFIFSDNLFFWHNIATLAPFDYCLHGQSISIFDFEPIYVFGSKVSLL